MVEPQRHDGFGRVSLAARPLVAAVKLYQVTLRPWLGAQCRFHPTCSAYAVEALRVHGALRGSWLSLRRLLRCHPLGGAGFDPVPHKDSGSHSRRDEDSEYSRVSHRRE